MKIIRPALLSAVLLSPLAAFAQTAPDRSVDQAPAADMNQAPTDVNVPSANKPYDVSTEYGRNREQLQTELSDIKREVETLRANISDAGRERLDSLSTRVDELEARTMAVSDERDFNENKHKFKNELKKIRKDLKGARKYRTMAPDASQTAPTNP